MKQDIDWSGFDINNYPKVNYYHILFNIKPEYARGKINKTFNDDGEVVFISICFILMGVLASHIDYHIISIALIVGAVILLISIPIVHVYGKKAYLKLCREMYRDKYLKKISFDRIEKNKQDIINNFINRDVEEHIIYNYDLQTLNSASQWFVRQGVPFGDIILLTKDGMNMSFEETKKAKEYGLPENYYVIAVKDTHWLCCNSEEECIYAFSKALGLTHTKYQSLYDYIMDACNISFDVEKGI